VIVLDGCCGAGGTARGYVDARHEVWGIDIAPQPNYLKSGAAGFQQADILQVLREPWTARVDFIHVSPPCQRHSAMSACRPGLAGGYPDLIAAVRELLNATGKPWVIENVPGAPLREPVTLCAQMFRPGTPLYRHRMFEAGGGLVLEQPPKPPAGLPGKRHRDCGWPHPLQTSRAGHWEPGTAMSVAGHVGNVALARNVMEIDWSTREELAEAIPPYFTRWVGHQLAAWAARKGDPDGGVVDGSQKCDKRLGPGDRYDWAWLRAHADHEAGREDDAVAAVVSLSEFRDLREEQREQWDWAARFRGWARTLADYDNRTPPGGWTGDDYLELCGVMTELLEGWADELDGKPRSGS
jgi:DNA (cytosine-5)-methyltransferase 1